MPAVRFRHWPTPVQARRGTILDAAMGSGVPMPYQCRSGECGSCKCRLLAGQVEHDDHLPEALSEQERSEGWVLACRARPKTDVEIDCESGPDLQVPATQRRRAAVERCDRLTDDIRRLVLALDGPALPFLPGQFVRLRFGRLPPRSYSMASLPGDDRLEFFVREVPDGRVSGHVARHLSLGDPVGLEGPCGQAYLRKSGPAPIVAAAGGSGLAPILAMAREAARSRMPCPFTLYFGVRRESDLFALPALAELAGRNPRLSLHIVLSDQPGGRNGFRGGFPHEAIAADFADLSQAQVYAAGPPPMVTAVAETASALGAQAENIHSDPFTSEPPTTRWPVARLFSRGMNLFGRSAAR